jgi:2-methylcitrate dehydratase PrpD
MDVDPAQTLAEHVCQTTFADLPEHAIVSSQHDILDTLGAALGGSVAPGIADLASLATEWGGREESSLLLLGGRVPAPQAALVNAAMGHVLDFDDTFDRAGNIHPGTSTLFASLAVAERRGGVPGQELLLAITLGLDVAARLALAATVDRGWHRTAMLGIFGATAAAGKLLGLRSEQVVHAFGIAYSQAAGNRQCILDGALTKRLQAGQAASSGVLAAILAQRHFTGAREVFAGRFGFYPMYQPEGYDLTAITDALGKSFRGAELSFKPYPCGRPHHRILDAAMALYRQLDLATAREGADIDDVVITTNPQTYHTEFGANPTKRRPTQVVEAQFSLPFLAATALALGRIGIADVSRVDNPTVLALADRMRGEPHCDAPPGWGRITVRRSDGRSASLETREHASGSPQLPLSQAQLEAKFRDCTANAARPIPDPVVGQAIDQVFHLDTAADATILLRLFDPATGS